MARYCKLLGTMMALILCLSFVPNKAFAAELSDTQTVSASSAVITSQPQDITAVVGNAARFSVKASGANLTYRWQWAYPGGNKWYNTSFTGYNTSALTIPSVSVTAGRDGYQYRCAITSGGKTIYSNPAVITVKTAAITAQPEDISVVVGDAARFSVKASGANLTYRWQWAYPGGNKWYSTSFTGYNTSALTIPSVSVTAGRDGYQYRCAITSGGKTIYSDPAVITVKKAAITTQPEDVTVDVGNAARFSVKASGTNLAYKWQYKAAGSAKWYNTGFPGNKTATLTIPADRVTAGRDGYQYRCVITSGDETIYSNPATITVKEELPEEEVSFNMAYISDFGWKLNTTASSLKDSYGLTTRVFFADGTSGVYSIAGEGLFDDVNVDEEGNLTWSVLNADNVDELPAGLYDVTVNSDNTVTIDALPGQMDGTIQQIKNKVTRIGETGDGDAIYANGKTRFWFVNNAGTDDVEVKVITGIDNVPTVFKADDAEKNYVDNVYNSDEDENNVADGLIVYDCEWFSITRQPKDITVTVGKAAHFRVGASGQDVTFKWQYKAAGSAKWYNTGFPGNKTATLTIPADRVTAGRDGYQYRCVITSGDETIYSNPATITVKEELPEEEVSFNMAYISDFGWKLNTTASSLKDSYGLTTRVFFADGTSGVYSIAGKGLFKGVKVDEEGCLSEEVLGVCSVYELPAGLYDVTVNSDNTVTIDALSGQMDGTIQQIKNKVTRIGETGDGDAIYANGKTRFWFVNNAGTDDVEVKVITGIDNVPTVFKADDAEKNYVDNIYNSDEDENNVADGLIVYDFEEETFVEGTFLYTGKYTIKKHTGSKKHDVIYKLYDVSTGKAATLTYTYKAYGTAAAMAKDAANLVGFVADGGSRVNRMVAYAGTEGYHFNVKFLDYESFGDETAIYTELDDRDSYDVKIVSDQTIFVDLTGNGLETVKDIAVQISKNEKTWQAAFSKQLITQDELNLRLAEDARVSLVSDSEGNIQTLFVNDVVDAYQNEYSDS